MTALERIEFQVSFSKGWLRMLFSLSIGLFHVHHLHVSNDLVVFSEQVKWTTSLWGRCLAIRRPLLVPVT